jgi:multidrug efflux pump
MTFLEGMLAQRRLILSSVALLTLLGIVSLFVVPKQEDPRLPYRWGQVVTLFPGADAEAVERLVLDPIEQHLAEVEEIKHVKSTVRAGVVINLIEFWDHVTDVDAAWDEVKDALTNARLEFPENVGIPVLDDKLLDTESVVLALTGTTDMFQLSDAAEALKKRLLSVPYVSRVILTADPGQQITIEYDDAIAQRLGIDPRMLARQLGARNATIPGGSIKLGGKKVIVRPNSEFESIEEIVSTPILLPSGAAIPLGEIARVRSSGIEPAAERMRFNGVPAVGLGVVPRQGIDILAFGDKLREELKHLRREFAPLQLHEVTFQPDRVRDRLTDLGTSLLIGITIVALVLVAAMGMRLGFLVASIVPIVVLVSLALYAGGGGILHQISITAFVIALGMLVDNAIVMSENVQRHIDDGLPPKEAAVLSVGELAIPLAAATGTTLAAFVPMLIAESTTADFTRALPVVIVLTLTVSYIIAVTVTPTLSAVFLKKSVSASSENVLQRTGSIIARTTAGHSVLVLVLAAVLLTGCLYASKHVDRQFFPAADRNQALLDLQLPEGSHLEGIDAAALKVEAALRNLPEVTSVSAFLGRSAPHFYYNVVRQPNAPHLAQILFETTDAAAAEKVIKWAREFVRRELPEVELVAQRLEQGNPRDAPIEIRLYSWNLKDTQKSADTVLAKLRTVPGAVDTRHNIGLGAPTVRFQIDDAAAGRRGLSRSDVALSVLGRTRGLEAGQYRAGQDPVPIYVRSKAGEDLPAEDLSGIDVASPGGKGVPLAQVAGVGVEWLPAAIYHRNRQRLVTVSAQLGEGVTYSRILDAFDKDLPSLGLPESVGVEYGGEAEGSSDANTAMLRAAPFGLFLLLFFLMAEFNSFRRVAIIMVTVPLAATGVIPGLLIAGQPFGFMSLLGVIALVGVVVNNAIVLVDLVEKKREEGATVSQALEEAVRLRTRPILLTTATTVAGLLPLAFSSATLWPPLAWAMISGLIASTGLTLLVVPALYRILFPERATAER